jgi:hypothetical protein
MDVFVSYSLAIGFCILDRDDTGSAAGIVGISISTIGTVAITIFSNVTNNKYAGSVSPAVVCNIDRLRFNTANLTKLVVAVVLAQGSLSQGAHLSYRVALAFGLCGCIVHPKHRYTNRTVALQEVHNKALEEKKGTGTA